MTWKDVQLLMVFAYNLIKHQYLQGKRRRSPTPGVCAQSSSSTAALENIVVHWRATLKYAAKQAWVGILALELNTLLG